MKMNLILAPPTTKEFDEIKIYIQAFELDNRDLQQAQFVVAIYNKIVVGFGRLRQHVDCMELCSLGVVPAYRKKRVGEKIILKLIKDASQPIYLVSVIPEFFHRFGFRKIEEYPAAIHNKLVYCTNELVTTAEYIVMRLGGDK